MKELQKSFKALLLLEKEAEDIYSEILEQKLGKDTSDTIRFIKRQETGHVVMVEKLIGISANAESRKKPRLSKAFADSLRRDVVFKKNMLNSVIELLNAKIRTFILLDSMGSEAAKFKKADKARRELIKIIVHELKSPLTVSSWTSELLLKKRGDLLTDAEKRMIEEIMASNKMMFSFIDDLLEMSRIAEAGSIKKETLDLVAVFEEVLDGLKYLLERQKQEIDFQHPGGIKVLGEKKSLNKIISNLLVNAVNYGKSGGTVLIKIEKPESGKVLFSVSDQGIGIPKDEQNNIFKKFFRASNAHNLYQKGTGLGLYIVKELVTKLGGKVWFKSEENKGATFYVSLRSAE